MSDRVVLAYDGGLTTSAAIPWLTETHGLEVVTITLDIGQGRDLGELRARALACGAVRAHALDARDEFARDVLLPSLYGHHTDSAHPAIAALPRPFIAKKLVEVAAIESARSVAHGSSHSVLDDEIRARTSSLQVLAPARTWGIDVDGVIAYAKQHRLPVPLVRGAYRVDQHLWGRMLTWEGDEEPPLVTRQLAEAALVDIHFEQGVPTAINGVPMAPAELIECLTLIAAQHGIGRTDSSARGQAGARRTVVDAPAAIVLHAAARASGGPGTTDVCLRLDDGRVTVLAPDDRQAALVNYA
jgi:argininosuccinate synthase